MIPQTTDELRELVIRAQAGDDATIPVLRKLFANPQFVDVLGGDLAREAMTQIVNRLAGTDHRVREAVLHKLELLQRELTDSHPTALDRLLVERVVACWLHLHYLELVANDYETIADRHQKHVQRAHQNYLSAIKTLATVRKLARPVVQVNIANDQVNVLNSASA